MSLEKDINQRKFSNEHHKALVNLIYTYNWMMEQMKMTLEKGDLTSQQYNILRILRGAGEPISTLQIRQRMLDKMSDTSRIVDRLVVKGLVKKVVCKQDKRLVDVSLSPKGLKLVEKMDELNQEMENILQNLNEAEVRTLNKLLDKARNSL
jgi:DNA-binding MarR family transcriptional regulator